MEHREIVDHGVAARRTGAGDRDVGQIWVGQQLLHARRQADDQLQVGKCRHDTGRRHGRDDVVDLGRVAGVLTSADVHIGQRRAQGLEPALDRSGRR